MGRSLAAILLIACAEIGGASMVRFKLELTRWARAAMLARPAVHGLVGVRDVDERILDEALVKFDAGLRLFHLHAEGMGLVIIATTMIAATAVALGRGPGAVDHRASHGRAARAILSAISSGAPSFPHYGLERSKTIAEWLVWIPFGGATIVAVWWLAGARSACAS